MINIVSWLSYDLQADSLTPYRHPSTLALVPHIRYTESSEV